MIMPKAYKVVISEEALEDLDRLYRFIGRDGVGRAGRFLDELKRKAFDLKYFPNRGASCRLLPGVEIRFLSHHGYLVFYQIKKDLVDILRVTGPGQDWLALFL